jgi:tetraacyldisaccharide 4'-kinase
MARDVEIILVNVLQFGPGMRLFPAGLLREPPRYLRRADQIWLTYAGAAASEQIGRVMRWCDRWAPHVPKIATHHRITACRPLGGGERVEIAGRRVAGFCGLGSPEGFHASVRELGPRSFQLKVFPDHHWYSAQELRELACWGKQVGAEVMLTTAKDAVRLPAGAWPAEGPPLAVAELSLEVLGEAAAQVQEVVRACLARPPVAAG